MSNTRSFSYPLKFKASAAFINELYLCEEGRAEDIGRMREDSDPEAQQIAADNPVVLHDFIGRWRTQFEVRNDEELCELFYVLGSGTIGLYAWHAADNLMDKVRPYVQEVNPKLASQHTCPTQF